MKNKCSVVGLGKLGGTWAAVLAAKGFEVVGVDLNERFVDAINKGVAYLEEPRFQEFIDLSEGRLRATADTVEAVVASDVTFVIVPTPSDENGRFTMRYVLDAATPIAEGIKKKDDFHLVVLTSTVMVGDTAAKLVPHLEKMSGKVCGRDFGVCYNPEFIALGNVINDMLYPDFVLVGETDPKSGEMLSEIYGQVCANDAPIARMNLVNAELVKIAVNTFVTTKISYANMLSQICAQLPGSDVEVVTSAIGLDTRIGRKYLRGAVAYGGPCFPRDNVAFSLIARDLGTEPLIAEATDEINDNQKSALVKLIRSSLPENGVVGVLGLSYKPDTPIIEESASIDLVNRLVGEGVDAVVYDPLAMDNARLELAQGVRFADSMEACAREADVLVLATAWSEFSGLKSKDLKPGTKPMIVDCWQILDPAEFGDACEYRRIGVGPAA